MMCGGLEPTDQIDKVKRNEYRSQPTIFNCIFHQIAFRQEAAIFDAIRQGGVA